MQIKRGVYTRVDAKGIESNEGTFFEAIMAPTYTIAVEAGDATANIDVDVTSSFFTVSSIMLHKVGSGAGGDGAALQRIRGGSTDDICTFNLSGHSSGDTLVPDPGSFDVSVNDFQPGDTLRLAVTQGMGNPGFEAEILVRID